MALPALAIPALISGGSQFLGGLGGSMIDSAEAAKDRRLQASSMENQLLQSGAGQLAERRNRSIERNRNRMFRDQMLQVLGM